MIDYAGLSVLTIAYKNVINHKGRMKFFAVSVCVKNILRSSMLDRVFEIYESEELALNSFKEDREIDRIQHMHLRRRFVRLPLDITVKYKARYGNTTEYEGKLLDLSGEGAFIFAKKTFSLHDILTINFTLPAGIGPLSAEVKVMWLSDKDVQPHQYPGMGVEFHKIDTATQKKIVCFIEKNTDCRSASNLPPV